MHVIVLFVTTTTTTTIIIIIIIIAAISIAPYLTDTLLLPYLTPHFTRSTIM